MKSIYGGDDFGWGLGFKDLGFEGMGRDLKFRVGFKDLISGLRLLRV